MANTKKAYDSVNRPLLLRKMVMCGLGPHFCQLIEHMCVQATSRIKVGAKLGQSFTTNVGLCQGDPLSPLLFNLFIADIVFAFKTNCDPPSLYELPIPSIQFAMTSATFPPRCRYSVIQSTLNSYIARQINSLSTFPNHATLHITPPTQITNLSQANQYYSLIDKAKQEYYRDRITTAGHDQKKLFNNVDSLLNGSTDTPLPLHTAADDLAERYQSSLLIKSIGLGLTYLINRRKSVPTAYM